MCLLHMDRKAAAGKWRLGDGGDRAKQPGKPVGQLTCWQAPCPSNPQVMVMMLFQSMKMATPPPRMPQCASPQPWYKRPQTGEEVLLGENE